MKNTGITTYLKMDKKTAKGFVPVYCKITCNGTTTKTFSFGESVDPERWKKTQKLTSGKMTEEEKKTRQNIDSTIYKLTKLVDILEYDNKSYSAELLVRKLFGSEETKNKSLLDAFALHKKEFFEDVAEGFKTHDSYKKYYSVQCKVQEFMALRNRTDIQLDELNDEFHKKFHKFLQTIKNIKTGKRLISTNQVTKYTYLFRLVVKRAVKNKGNDIDN